MARFLAAVFLSLGLAFPALAQEPDYAIENVTGDLYLFKAGGTNSVFLVTDEGIILADPVSPEAAGWLKDELDERFGQPVRYVIYSHAHADHASGGEAFEATAEFVSHYLAAEEIEAGAIGPAPEIRFPHRYRLTLGGKAAELYYFGPSHSENLITVYFPEEKAVFLVDAVGVKRLPYRDLPDYHVPGVIAHLMQVEEMDFEILIPGHGNIGVKNDLADHRKYLQDLALLVGGALQQGFTVGEMKAFIQLEPYRGWANYEQWRELNIEGMARIIRQAMVEEDPPEPVEEVDPRFPRFARKMRISGWVALEFDITEQGQAQNIRIIDSSASTTTRGITDLSRAIVSFEKYAVKALKEFRFTEGEAYQQVRHVISYYIPPSDDSDQFDDVFFATQLSPNYVHSPSFYNHVLRDNLANSRR